MFSKLPVVSLSPHLIDDIIVNVDNNSKSHQALELWNALSYVNDVTCH